MDLLLAEFAMDDQALYAGDGLPFELLLRAALSRRPTRPALVNVMGWGRRLSWVTAQEPQVTPKHRKPERGAMGEGGRSMPARRAEEGLSRADAPHAETSARVLC